MYPCKHTHIYIYTEVCIKTMHHMLSTYADENFQNNEKQGGKDPEKNVLHIIIFYKYKSRNMDLLCENVMMLTLPVYFSLCIIFVGIMVHKVCGKMFNK